MKRILHLVPKCRFCSNHRHNHEHHQHHQCYHCYHGQHHHHHQQHHESRVAAFGADKFTVGTSPAPQGAERILVEKIWRNLTIIIFTIIILITIIIVTPTIDNITIMLLLHSWTSQAPQREKREPSQVKIQSSRENHQRHHDLHHWHHFRHHQVVYARISH